MTQLLRTYLKLALGEPNGRALQRIVEREIPRELGTVFDGKPEPVRELLLSTAIESTTLIQTEMYNTVIEGAEPFKCMRQALKVLPMTANTLTITIGEAGSYAGEVAEGAEIPIAVQDYSAVTFTAKKYAVRPLITKEMVEDSLYPVIEMEVRKAGAKLENTLNQLALTELIDNTSNNELDVSVATGTAPNDYANAGTKAIVRALRNCKADGFLCDTIVMSPDAEAVVMAEFTPTSYVGAEAVASGRLPNIMGLKAFTCGVADASSQTWEYNSDGDIGMVVFDSQNSSMIGMRRDITVERYEDPIRDLVGMSATMRCAVDTLQANAGARIEY
jgi:hypothetical protein